MTGALPETSVVCLVCETPAFHGDRFCEACGALLPESAIAQPTPTLDLEQLFSHTGRIGRLEYLVSAVILTLFLLLALGLLAAMIDNILGVVLGGALVVAAAFALTCATIKRLHDINTTGWLAAIGVIPLVGWVFIVVLALIGPGKEQNTYGLPEGGSIQR